MSMHAKYEVSIYHSTQVIANVKVFLQLCILIDWIVLVAEL